jgi:hypothetical protein
VPDTVLGLVVLLASLGPGFVYLRVAERRGPRVPRSGLIESVELVVLGAAASAVTVLVVALGAAALRILTISALARTPAAYYHRHPVLVIGLAAAALIAAYPVAWAMARVVYRGKPVTNVPGSAWSRMLTDARPSKDHGVFATVELRDGRKLSGTVASYTLDEENPNREIALWEPRILMPGQTRPSQLGLEDRFVLLREADVVAISGQYYTPSLVRPVRTRRLRRKTLRLRKRVAPPAA